MTGLQVNRRGRRGGDAKDAEIRFGVALHAAVTWLFGLFNHRDSGGLETVHEPGHAVLHSNDIEVEQVSQAMVAELETAQELRLLRIRNRIDV
jgi:hypothetical protein